MNQRDALRRTLVTVATSLVALAALLSPAPAQAATPQLKVALDNGQADAKAGGTSVYTVTVTNLGTSKVRDLRLSQSVPAGARLVSAGGHGRLTRGQVTWTVDLPASGTRTVRTTLRLDKKTPDTLLRLATVACVRRTADGPPLVCAADSDELPAGAAAANGPATTTPSSPASGVSAPWWAYGGAGAVLLLAAGAAVQAVGRRRRRAAAAVGTPQ